MMTVYKLIDAKRATKIYCCLEILREQMMVGTPCARNAPAKNELTDVGRSFNPGSQR
jgi:hypothetical protein